MSSHRIVHVELPTDDIAASGAFYADLFGWKINPMPQFNYATFDPGDGYGGGFPKIDGQLYSPGSVLIYVDTDDIEASLAKAESLGAQTTVPKTEIPGMGHFAVFTDPSGNRIALYHGRLATD